MVLNRHGNIVKKNPHGDNLLEAFYRYFTVILPLSYRYFDRYFNRYFVVILSLFYRYFIVI